MSNDLQQQNSTALVASSTNSGGAMSFAPQRALAAGVNAGAVSIESDRAVAEAQGQLVLAKRFPRDLNAAFGELMAACKHPAFAAVAFYSKPQGGSKVTGPSVRLAEEVARVVGNFEYGHRELSRVEATPATFGRSEVEVYAWDKEKNNRSTRQITVMHILDTREGPKKLRDQTDVDNKIANVASKQMRGRILALMPKWLVESAVEECKKTLTGNNDEPIESRVRKMTQAFAKFGVTVQMMEGYLGHKLDSTTVDELVDLLGVYNAIRDGGKASEFFASKEEAVPTKPAPAGEAALAAAPAAAPVKQAAAASPAPAAEQAAPKKTRATAAVSKPVEEPAAPAVEQAAAPVVETGPEDDMPLPADGGDDNPDVF